MTDPGARRQAILFRTTALLAVVLVLIGAGVAGLRYEWMSRASPPQPALVTAVPSPPNAEVDAGALTAAPTGNPEAQLRQAADGLSKRPEWESWIAEPHVISRLVAGAYRVAAGENVPPILLFFAPDRNFAADKRDGKLFLSHETIASRATVTEVVTSIDPERAAAAYTRLTPLFEAAFREIAHPDERLTSELHQAIHELRTTPVPATDPAVVKNGTAYFFEDEQLEKLHPAQKQLLRMGNANAHKIQQWLAALDRALPP